MNKLLLYLCTAYALFFLNSCSTEEMQNSNNSSIVGVWELIAWNIDGGFDINGDGAVSTNLLNEIECTYNETLFFEANNIVSLNTTFNPNIDIALLNDTTDKYSFNIECDNEGIISLATEYSLNDTTVVIGTSEGQIEDNQISIVFKNRIEIYNEDFTQIIDTKDLTLVYIKK